MPEGFLFTVLEVMSAVLLSLLTLALLVMIGLYIADVAQTKHAILRNYPIVGRFRYYFEHLGECFRQYFFAMDREELPFNRAQRSWAIGRRRTSKHRRLRLQPRSKAGRHGAVRELSVADTR